MGENPAPVSVDGAEAAPLNREEIQGKRAEFEGTRRFHCIFPDFALGQAVQGKSCRQSFLIKEKSKNTTKILLDNGQKCKA